MSAQKSQKKFLQRSWRWNCAVSSGRDLVAELPLASTVANGGCLPIPWSCPTFAPLRSALLASGIRSISPLDAKHAAGARGYTAATKLL